MIFAILLYFLLGTVVGSFLNVVVLRHGTGISIVGGRSRCFSCARTLLWYELVPVLSFAVLRGRCRTCRSSLSLQYPAVELVTGLVFALTALGLSSQGVIDGFELTGYQLLVTIYYLTIFSFLVAMSIYDIRHKIIPNGFVYSFIFFSFAGIFFIHSPIYIYSAAGIWHLLAGPILAMPLALLFFISNGKWMGFGDVKLAFGTGWFLGLSSGAAAFVLSFWIGATVAIFILLVNKIGLLCLGKGVTMKSEIPFGPFMALAIFLSFLFGLGIEDLMFL